MQPFIIPVRTWETGLDLGVLWITIHLLQDPWPGQHCRHNIRLPLALRKPSFAFLNLMVITQWECFLSTIYQELSFWKLKVRNFGSHSSYFQCLGRNHPSAFWCFPEKGAEFFTSFVKKGAGWGCWHLSEKKEKKVSFENLLLWSFTNP